MTVYIDINTQYGQDVTPLLLPDMQAIQNKMMNLFRCPLGSRFRQSEFGTNLNKHVHQPTDSITTNEILTDLMGALARWMKGEVVVNMAESYVVPRPSADGYVIKISYSVPKLNAAGALSFAALRN